MTLPEKEIVSLRKNVSELQRDLTRVRRVAATLKKRNDWRRRQQTLDDRFKQLLRAEHPDLYDDIVLRLKMKAQ